MTERDAQRWDSRYEDVTAISRAAVPVALAASGLVDLVPHTGRAIDIACGLGAQTLWLAERGLHVLAVDASSEALIRARSAVDDCGLGDIVTTFAWDLDRGVPPFRPDAGAAAGTSVVAGESSEPPAPTKVDVVVCQRFRDPRLYSGIIDGLAPGGLGVITVLSVVGADNPREFHAPSGELEQSFTASTTDVLWHDERNGEASVVFRRR